MATTTMPPRPPLSSLYPAGGYIPPGASLVHRFSWQRPRWFEWLKYRQLKCPAGHHLPNNYEIDEDGSGRIRCLEPIAGMRGGCGLWVWVTRIRGHGHIVVEVTERDLAAMGELSNPSQKLDYLAVFEQLERVR